MTFLAVLLAPLMGVGIATFIIGVFLAPNDIGDSTGSKFHYTGNPRYDCRIDQGSRSLCERAAAECYLEATGSSYREEIAGYYLEKSDASDDDSYYVGTVKVTPLGKNGSSVRNDHDEE